MKMSSPKSALLLLVITSVQGMFQKTIAENLLKTLWSSQQSYELPLLKHPLFDQKIAGDTKTSICFDESGRFLRYLFYKDSSRHVFIFNTVTGKLENRVAFVKDSSVQAMDFGFDYTSGRGMFVWHYLEGNKAFTTKQFPYAGDPFMSFYSGKNGITVGSCFKMSCKNNVYEGFDTIVLYETDTFKTLQTIQPEDKKVSRLRSSICLSPDNTILAMLLHDGSIWLIHVKKPIIESVESFYDVVVKCEQ